MPEEKLRELLNDALGGSQLALAKLISIVEKEGEDSFELDRLVFKAFGTKRVLGITGPPGAGKSSLTSKLVKVARKNDLKIGVLAVDPSSPFSGGAILGDRVRMNEHSLDEKVFIRSFASRGHLGGLARAVPKAIRVLEYLNFDFVIIETVGVGQVELEIMQVAHQAVVVLNPGWGDSVQAAKAGLLEIGDVFVVNKADRPGAKETVRDLENMLKLGPQKQWVPPVIQTTATDSLGITDLYEALNKHWDYLVSSGLLQELNNTHIKNELESELSELIKQRVLNSVDDYNYQQVLKKVLSRELDPHRAAQELLSSI
jgi:LAO/AO transport system kinase